VPLTKQTQERIMGLFNSIACLAAEGPEVTPHTKLFELIAKEASEGYALCRFPPEAPVQNSDPTCVCEEKTRESLGMLIRNDWGSLVATFQCPKHGDREFRIYSPPR